jgi:hypothetical protein
MTHKEKAKDLVNTFYYSLPNNGSTEGINSTTRRYQEAIKCALIAVDEIMKSHEMSLFCEDIVLDFWKEVKSEIKKL